MMSFIYLKIKNIFALFCIFKNANEYLMNSFSFLFYLKKIILKFMVDLHYEWASVFFRLIITTFSVIYLLILIRICIYVVA